MIDPKYEVLTQLLERRLFRVPNYQRTYSWESKQRNDLFFDIDKLLKYPEERHHFMATIVCFDRKENATVGADIFNTLEIVDGQQRLTTLIILLKAIEKNLDSKKDKKLKTEISELLIKADKRLILLQINHDSDQVFSSYLKKGSIPDENKLKTQAESNLYNAFVECENFVRAWKQKKNGLVELVKLLRHRLGFIFYNLEDEGVVYTVFNALNSRGLDVDWLDKTKSMLMGIVFEKFKAHASKVHLDNLHGIWTKIYEMLGKKDIPGQEILRFAATLKQPKEPSKPLSAEDAFNFFQEYCSGAYDNVVEICEWLRDIAAHLHELYADPRLSAVTDIAHARLLAVAIMQTNLSHADRAILLEAWEKMTFKIFGLCRKDARHGVGEYIRLASKVHTKALKTRDQILGAMKQISDTYSIDTAIKEMRGSNCYEGWENDLKYLFFRYEEHLCKIADRNIAIEVWRQIWSKSPLTTIEHIHPQQPGVAWRGKLKGRALQRNIHRLGNLAILPPNLNSKIGQKSFSEKKKAYQATGLILLREIIVKKDWDKKAIDEREEKLLAWIRKEWNV